MSDLMKIVLLLSASGTVLAAALAVLRRVLKNKLPKALFYYLWLLVLLRLVVPVALPVPGLELNLSEPEPVEQALELDPELTAAIQQAQNQLPPNPSEEPWEIVATTNTGELPSVPATPEPPAPAWYETLWEFLCDHFTLIWLVGAAIHFAWFALSYLRFCRSLKAGCKPLWEHEQALLDDLRGGQKVIACRSPLAGTPMLVGLLRHRIVLPDSAITTQELEYILRHELTHLGRRDLLYKWFAVAATSFHWFNPLMPWLRREISRCCELSCDEAVIRHLNDSQKQAYGETLLALAALHALPRAVPATTLCEEKKQLKERLVSIMKHKKATAIILLLSCLLALLIAGCAAVLGPTLKQEKLTGPLTEEQQAPILEAIRSWAAENVETQGETEIRYTHDPEEAYGVGMLSTLDDASYVYDLHTGDIRLVDGTYPDTAELGYVQLAVREGETLRDYRIFHLTNGDPAKAVSPFTALEQLAADYPEGRVTQLQWDTEYGQDLYIRVDFVSEGAGYCFESTSINGLSNVRENQNATQREQGMTLPVLVRSLKAVIGWQETESSEHDRENYFLGMWNHGWLRNMMQYGDFAEFQEMVVYDLATDEIAVTQKPYTGTAEYGAFTLLYPAEEARRWVYIVDDSGDHSLRAGALAVVTEETPLENAFAQTVDAEGRTVVMDMAMTLQKGDLVYLDSVEGANCAVTVLKGEPPQVQGTLNARLLTTDLTEANQVLLQDTKTYDDAGGTARDTRSGVAQIEQQTPAWLQVSLPGGEAPFWVRRVDLSWEWPLAADPVSWLEAQYTDHTVLASDALGGKTILLAGVTNPGAEDYQTLSAYILSSGAQPSVLAKREGERSFSAGLSAHGMTDGEITILFGDTDDSVYDYQNDARIAVQFTEVRIMMADGQVESRAITGDGPYLVVLEGARQIEDVAFVSGADVYLYSDFYSAPVMPLAASETMTGGALKSYYLDFAMDWRVDFIPDFNETTYSGTVSSQDFLMLTYYIHRDSLPEDGSMSADLVEMVMETQFGIEAIQHESLFKTWNWDEASQKYLPVPQGVAEEGLFDVTAFGSAVRWVEGSEQTVYTLTLREYGFPFVYGTADYDGLAAYAADESAHYQKNVAFLLEQKGELLKKGEISAFDAMGQLILEGNTSGFTKGVELQLEYYMTGNGPRFLYKSEREFDGDNTGEEVVLPTGLLVHMRQLEDGRFFLLYDQPTQVQGGVLNITKFWTYDSRTGSFESLASVEADSFLADQLIVKDGTVLCSNGSQVLRFTEEYGRWEMESTTMDSLTAVSPDLYRYAAREDETVAVRTWQNERLNTRLEGFRNINRMVWNGDGTRLAVLSDHAFVTVWDEVSGSTVHYQGEHPQGWVNLQNIWFADDGKQVVMEYLCEDGAAMMVWDVEQEVSSEIITGRELSVVDVQGGAVLYVRREEAGYTYTLNLYDCRIGESQTIDRYEGVYTTACFAGDGRQVLVNRYDIGTSESRLAFLPLNAQSDLYARTAAWLEQEFHRVYDPWYDIQELLISNWQESGNQATFHYKMTWLNHNRDPDIVPYIMEAKAQSQSSYETLYKDYLALKEANYIFKIVWNGDTPTLYSDVSVKGGPEWALTAVDDYVLSWNDPEDSRKVFGEILWNALLKGELPNGSKLDWWSVEEAAENEFAVTDIDGDGREELLLSWTNAIMARHGFMVYGCWRGAVYTQLSEFPSLRFYDNGAVEVEWSHNQGGSWAIWPYDAYRYDTESDTYQFIGAAEAWNKSARKEGFPDDVDADGDGVVYYLLPVDWEGMYSNGEIVDGDEYLEWRESWLGDGKEVTVTFQKLTEENIAKLGAPKPEVVTPEPVG